MQKYWSNFAKTGNPNGAGLPQWPPYNASSGWQYMVLDEKPEAERDAKRERYLFLSTVWDK
jgi:para-nitrobenzyl esterase